MSKKPAKKAGAASKKGKEKAGGAPKSAEVTLSGHPRAQSQIRRSKSWAALAGFGLASYAAWTSGTPFVDTVLRGLMWGVLSYLIVWACAVQVWRHLAIAEVRAAEKVMAGRQAAAEELARARLEETMMLKAERGA